MAKRSTAPPKRRATISRCCSTICRGPSKPRAPLAEQLRAVGSESTREGRGVRPTSRASSPSARETPTRSSREATDRLAARLAEIEAAGTTAAARVSEAEAGLFGYARCAARPHRRQRSNEIRTGIDVQASRGRGAGRAGFGGHRQGRRRRGRIARDQYRPRQHLARRPVGPRRRAGPRIAAHDCRNRPRPGADRRALHRTCRQWRRARQPLPPIADPRPDRARHARRAGQHAGRRDRLARRAHRRAARQHRPARRTRSATVSAPRSAKRRAAPTGWSKPPRRRGRRSAGYATPRSRPATGLSATGRRDRRAAASGSRLCSRASTSGVEDAQSKLAELASMLVAGRARSGQPQRRNRPGADRVAGPGQGSRRPRRRPCARSDRGGHPGKPPASFRRKPRDALERVIRESVEDRLRDVETVAARAVEFGARGIRPADRSR